MPHSAPRHQPQRPRRPDNRTAEKRERDKFYKTARWLRFRRWYLSDPANVICHECKRAPATEVDHVLTLKARPDLALHPANMRALCASCHSKRTRADQLARD